MQPTPAPPPPPGLRVPRLLRPPRVEVNDAGRAVLLRILIAIFWIPVQITLSLLFATGAMFLVLTLGLVLAPFVGAWFLGRRVVRRWRGRRRGGVAPGAGGEPG